MVNLTNNVTVTSKENDTPVKDNETVEVIPVILTVNKTADVTVVMNDTVVTFTIAVNNTSEITATNVVVTDSLPEGLEFVSASVVGDDIKYSFIPNKDDRTFTWTIPELNGSVELLITAKTPNSAN